MGFRGIGRGYSAYGTLSANQNCCGDNFSIVTGTIRIATTTITVAVSAITTTTM